MTHIEYWWTFSKHSYLEGWPGIYCEDIYKELLFVAEVHLLSASIVTTQTYFPHNLLPNAHLSSNNLNSNHKDIYPNHISIVDVILMSIAIFVWEISDWAKIVSIFTQKYRILFVLIGIAV